MRIRKSFFAQSIEAALTKARKELGDETLLVQSRASRPEQQLLGAYEVIVEAGEASTESSGSQLSQEFSWRDLSIEVARLREDLRRVSELVFRTSAVSQAARLSPRLAPVASRLAGAEFPAELTADLLDSATARMTANPALLPEAAVMTELAGRLQTESSLAAHGHRSVVALVGPPGAGKTTTLIKLAMRYGITEGIPTLLVATDTCRVSAAEQLRSFAGILGLPYVVADTPGSLARTLEEHSRKELILIDTPGFGPADVALAKEWSGLMASHPDITTDLVLPSTLRFPDMRRLMERWAKFRPSRLILSRIDETAALGPALSAAIFAEKPVSFLTCGQTIPEDLLVADATNMAARALQLDASLQAAA